MLKSKYILLICLVMALVGCKRLLKPFAPDNVVVASVGERELHLEDVEDIFTKGMEREDSIMLLESFVNMWVKNQLKLERAEAMFSESQEDIDKMVKEYRNSLLNYKLDQYYIDKDIDANITDKDIEEYYVKNAKEFRLDKVIVKGRVVKVPETYRQAVKLKEIMASSNSEKKQDFLDICEKNNFQLAVFDQWVEFDEVLGYLPTRKGGDYTKLLTQKGVQTMADATNRYLFIISEHMKDGDVTPIELTKDRIQKIILNKRRVDVIRRYEDSLFIRAQKENRIIVNIEKDQVIDSLIN